MLVFFVQLLWRILSSCQEFNGFINQQNIFEGGDKGRDNIWFVVRDLGCNRGGFGWL